MIAEILCETDSCEKQGCTIRSFITDGIQEIANYPCDKSEDLCPACNLPGCCVESESDDPILDWLIEQEGNGFADEFCGSVTETGDYYGLHYPDADNESSTAGWIYHEDSQGFRNYTQYDPTEELEADWEEIQNEQDGLSDTMNEGNGKDEVYSPDPDVYCYAA